MEQHTLFYRFGIALFIGILVGLQREHAFEMHRDEAHDVSRSSAGVRTFALMSLAGAVAAMAADLLRAPAVFLGIVASLTILITVSYFITSARGEVGITTEVSAVVTILAGALCYWDQLALAAAIGVTTTVLLSLKFEMQGFVARLTREDILAALKFAVITAIILPILPNDTFGPPPFDVLNPYRIWLMVVLISGISFLGYVLIKLVGTPHGIVLTGLLGGLASSTAVTLSFTERSRRTSELAKPFALAITLAWAVMFARVLVWTGTLNPALLRVVWLPIVAAGAAGLAYGAYLYFAPQTADEEDVNIANPFELGPAIKFGLLYAVISVLSRGAQYYFGDTGVYISSVVSGLADVDAITLSMAQLSQSAELELGTAARAIVLATMSNTVVKGGIVLSGGTATLRKAILPAVILILVTGIAVAFLM